MTMINYKKRDNMEYSDEDLTHTYDVSQSDIPVWNAGSVYFDEEVVQYQGKYYKALRKTSAELPGRSKAGIWKELDSVEDGLVYDTDNDLYDDDIVPSPVESKTKVVQHVAKAKKSGQNSSTTKAGGTVKKSVNSSEQVKTAPKVDISPVNKPITKKKTLQEQQDEKNLKQDKIKANSSSEKENSIAAAEVKKMTKSVVRKMTITPNDQHIVNDILREIDFQKIRGLNKDDNNITSNLILTKNAKEESILIWESSHPDVISSSGEVHCPKDGHDVAVNLSVTVRKNQTSSTRFFTLWVKAAEKIYSDEECVNMVFEALNFEHIKGQNLQENSITHDLELLTHGLYNTEIFWASTRRDILDETGHLFKERVTHDTAIRLYAIINKANVERLKYFDLILKL